MRVAPLVGGNKRTAIVVADEFLFSNDYEVTAASAATVEMVLAVEVHRRGVGEVES